MLGKRPLTLSLAAMATIAGLCLAPHTDSLSSVSPISDSPFISCPDLSWDSPRTEPPTAQHDLGKARKNLARKSKKILANGPKRNDEPQQAMEFHIQQRLPAGTKKLPLEQLRRSGRELARREKAVAATRGAAPQGITGWSSVGPGNVGGRTRALVIDPVSPNIIYAAGVAGGIWKSVDSGASWASADDFMLNLAVVTLAIDPSNTNILYAGTGEGFFNSDAVRGLGIFKSIDAGATWTQLAGTVVGVPDGAFHRVNDIVLSPNDPTRLYAATSFGVWRSTDSGTTWQAVLTNPVFLVQGGVPTSNGNSIGCLELAIRSDTNPDTIFAAFGSFQQDGLFRSQDGGASWSQLGTVADLQNASQGRMALAIAPSNNNVIYVCMANSGGQLVNVYRSIDGGNTWTPRVDFGTEIGPLLLSNLPFGTGCFGNSNNGQGWYDNVIAVDPLDENVVWVGGVDLFRSDDGGQNFGIASYWYFSEGDPLLVHADQHAIVFHPQYDGVSNQTMYVGDDGGLYRTNNARAAVSLEDCPTGGGGQPLPEIIWEDLNNGYGVTQFYHGDVATDSDVLGGGTQDNGTLLVSSTTTPDSWEEIIGGDGGYFAIDPTNSMIMYGETQRFPRMRKSVDGGQSFTSSTNGITDADGLFITPFAIDESDPSILWTGGSRAWRTTDGASLWTVASNNFALGSRISAIGIAPSDSQTVYLGFSNGTIAKSTDALAGSPTWTEFNNANGLNNGFISSVTVHPTDPNIAYCTYSTFNISHILRTVDGGTSWTSIDGLSATGIPDIPVHWLAVRACNPNQLFVGTELGVFESDDGGAIWQPANNGLAQTVVETLAFQNNYSLAAFTHGRGAFFSALSCPCDLSDPVLDCNINGDPDECDIAFDVSLDCNENAIPDECDLTSFASPDCNGNGIPDECELDCNTNDIPDECDIADLTSPDCNNNAIPDECEADCNSNGVPDDCDITDLTSPDCNNNTFPDECDVAGGLFVEFDFEDGLPSGWQTIGTMSITDQCVVSPTCNGNQWAYAGDTGDCSYGDLEFGELITAPITLGGSLSELRFCSSLDSELDFDFAMVQVNGVEVSRESGSHLQWEERSIDLSAFAGQAVTVTFRFESDGAVSGTLGWQIDHVRFLSDSLDCNGNGIPDECDISSGEIPDANTNGIPDDCEGGCCLEFGGCLDLVTGLNSCSELGGTFLTGQVCTPDPCPSPAVPPAPAPPPHDRRKNRYISFVPNNPLATAFRVELLNLACSTTAATCTFDSDCKVCQGGGNAGNACNISSDCPDGACLSSGETCETVAPPIILGWVGEPRDGSCQDLDTGAFDPALTCEGVDFVSRVQANPFIRVWNEPVVHIGDCEIAPVHSYGIRASIDGLVMTDMTAYATITKPQGKFWADLVGGFDGTVWTAPNGLVGVDDVSAMLKFITLRTAPHITVIDLGGEAPNWLINASDLQFVLRGFKGKTYPPIAFPNQGSPADCP